MLVLGGAPCRVLWVAVKWREKGETLDSWTLGRAGPSESLAADGSVFRAPA